MLCAGAPSAAVEPPQFLSPTNGPIAQLLLAAPNADPVHRLALAGVARLFGGQVRYRVVAPRETFAPIAEALRGAGAREVAHIPALARITPWVRDPVLVLRTPAGLAWAPAATLDRAGDTDIVSWAARADPALTTHPALPFAGGNLVMHGAHVFVGGPADALPADWRAVASGTLTPGPWAGRGQPLYHLDLYFAVVGPPAAPVLVVGAVPPPSAGLPGGVRGENELRAALDAVATDLMREGFAVRRVPVLRIRDPDDGAPLLVTYTNVLLDQRAGRPVVYLPRYGGVLPGLAALDGAAAAVFHDLGYAVVWYEGPLRALARAGAGLRCLVLETARGD